MRARAAIFSLVGLQSLLLSSCFIVKVPLNVTSSVLSGTAKAGSKAAKATKDAFSKSDEEKAEEEKKKKLKEDADEKKKKEDEIMQQQQQQQQPQTPGYPAPYSTPAAPPSNDGHYKPSITPSMIKGGQQEKEVTPTPVQGGY